MIAKIERMREEDRVNNDNHENHMILLYIVSVKRGKAVNT